MLKKKYVFANDVEMKGKLEFFPKQYSSLKELQSDLLDRIDILVDRAVEQQKYDNFRSFYLNSVVFEFDVKSGDATRHIYPAYDKEFSKLRDKLKEIDNNVKMLKKGVKKLNKQFGLNVRYEPT